MTDTDLSAFADQRGVFARTAKNPSKIKVCLIYHVQYQMELIRVCCYFIKAVCLMAVFVDGRWPRHLRPC